MPNTPPIQNERLQEILHFNPRWWWDPVPWWVMEHLRPQVINELAHIQLEFQKQVLQAQIETLDRTIATMGKAK